MATTGTKKATGAAASKALEGDASQAAGAATTATNTDAAGAAPIGVSVTGEQDGQASNTSGLLPAVDDAGSTQHVHQTGQLSDAEIAQLGAAPAETVLDNSSTIQPLGLFQRFDVRVLAPVTIGCERFNPNDVIEGLPAALAEAHAGSVDPHPDAVAYARSTGALVRSFEPLTE